MGSSRSHPDFYRGEGRYLSGALAAMVVMCGLLSNSTAESPALVRRLSLVIAVQETPSACDLLHHVQVREQ